MWGRICAANVAGDDLRRFAQSSQSPLKIENRKSAAFPVCYRLFCAKAIEIDRDINTFFAEVFYELVKVLPPILAQNGAATLSIFRRTFVRPGMDFKNTRPFRAAISEKLMRPPAFKISTAPNCDVLYLRKFQSAIHPTAAAPFRRAHVPVRVIVEGENSDGLGETPNPERSQIMKITGAVEQKRGRKLCLIFAVKLGDQPWRRGETQFRPPIARIDKGQIKRLISPCVIQIEMKSAADQRFYLGDCERN